jgi:hypothetical protein
MARPEVACLSQTEGLGLLDPLDLFGSAALALGLTYPTGGQFQASPEWQRVRIGADHVKEGLIIH